MSQKQNLINKIFMSDQLKLICW